MVEDSSVSINFGAYEDIPVEATGTDIAAPVSTFAEIDLGEAINQNIKRCNYTKPTPIQRHAIPVAVGGRDLMACAQTGSGKTAAYCLPIIHGVLKSKAHVKRTVTRVVCPLALVLSPTRELSCQVSSSEMLRFLCHTFSFCSLLATPFCLADQIMQNFCFVFIDSWRGQEVCSPDWCEGWRCLWWCTIWTSSIVPT